MTDALAQRLVRFLDASAPVDRERRQLLSDLYLVHWKGLCGYVRAQFGPGPPEPEDVAQSAFIRFAAADAAHIENPRAFLYATARNLVIDHHRHAQRVCAHEQATQKIGCTNCRPRTSYCRPSGFASWRRRWSACR